MRSIWLRRWASAVPPVERSFSMPSPPGQGDAIRQALEQFPVGLARLSVSELFFPDEWSQLEVHLLDELRADETGHGHRSIREFFVVAERRSVGAPTLNLTLLDPQRIRPQNKNLLSLYTLQYQRLPKSFPEATLSLTRESNDFVVMTLSFATAMDKPLLLADLVPPEELQAGPEKFLSRCFGSFAGLPIFPSALGALGEDRYPSGAWVVWSLPKAPDIAEPEWGYLTTKMLACPSDTHYDGQGLVVWRGVPSSSNWSRSSGLSDKLFNDGLLSTWSEAEGWDRRRGVSVVVPLELWTPEEWLSASEVADNQSDRLRRLYHMPILVESAATILDDRAGALAAELGKEVKQRFRTARLAALRALVSGMDMSTYRVSRVRKWASENEPDKLWINPDLALDYHYYNSLHSGEPHQPLQSGKREYLHDQIARMLAPANFNHDSTFLRGVGSNLDRLLDSAAEDMRISRERATSLLELTSTFAMVVWTVVVGLVAVATLVVTLVTSL